MYRFIFIILIFTICFASVACEKKPVKSENFEQEKQADESLNKEQRVKNLKWQANEFYSAMLEDDLEKTKKFVYFPIMLKKDNSLEEIETYRKRNAKNSMGVALELKALLAEYKLNLEIKDPEEIIKADYEQLYSVVPIDITAKLKQKNCVIRTYKLGVSQDGGKTWEFLKGDSSYQNGLKKFFPEAAKRIKLPALSGMKCT